MNARFVRNRRQDVTANFSRQRDVGQPRTRGSYRVLAIRRVPPVGRDNRELGLATTDDSVTALLRHSADSMLESCGRGCGGEPDHVPPGGSWTGPGRFLVVNAGSSAGSCSEGQS